MTNPTGMILWYWGSTLVLAVLLYFPTRKLIWVASVRRLERRLGRKSTDQERQERLRVARILAALIAVTFAFLYNRTLMPPA